MAVDLPDDLPPWISPSGFRALVSAVEDDITALGEALRDLDAELGDRALEDDVRRRYLQALDAYETAKERGRIHTVRDARPVVEMVAEGRSTIAWLRAWAGGEEPPEQRAPCFFDPQHGPSTEEVSWAPFGGEPRPVPACAADADRVRSGRGPLVREVDIDGRRRPYWEAGAALAQWVIGYYGRYGLTRTAYHGTPMASLVSGT